MSPPSRSPSPTSVVRARMPGTSAIIIGGTKSQRFTGLGGSAAAFKSITMPPVQGVDQSSAALSVRSFLFARAVDRRRPEDHRNKHHAHDRLDRHALAAKEVQRQPDGRRRSTQSHSARLNRCAGCPAPAHRAARCRAGLRRGRCPSSASPHCTSIPAIMGTTDQISTRNSRLQVHRRRPLPHKYPGRARQTHRRSCPPDAPRRLSRAARPYSAR